jgi:hypothetical protein
MNFNRIASKLQTSPSFVIISARARAPKIQRVQMQALTLFFFSLDSCQHNLFLCENEWEWSWMKIKLELSSEIETLFEDIWRVLIASSVSFDWLAQAPFLDIFQWIVHEISRPTNFPSSFNGFIHFKSYRKLSQKLHRLFQICHKTDFLRFIFSFSTWLRSNTFMISL